jgi:hypothetical protein
MGNEGAADYSGVSRRRLREEANIRPRGRRALATGLLVPLLRGTRVHVGRHRLVRPGQDTIGAASSMAAYLGVSPRRWRTRGSLRSLPPTEGHRSTVSSAQWLHGQGVARASGSTRVALRILRMPFDEADCSTPLGRRDEESSGPSASLPRVPLQTDGNRKKGTMSQDVYK